MKIRITKPKKEDCSDYYELKKLECAENTLLTKETVGVPLKLKEDFNKSLTGERKDKILFAKSGKIIAYVRYALDTRPEKRRVFIADLFVKKGYRKKGIATKLIQKIFQLSKRKKLNKVRLKVLPNNEKAIKLYEKLGFNLQKYQMEKKLK
jgi:ribosomal protein S18 acetylase RimI-like enzyme